MARWQTLISSLTAGQSATIFTATTAVRWRVDYALIGSKNATATSSVSLYEQGATTTVLVFGFVLTSQNQIFEMKPIRAGGWTASSVSSRLAFNNADGGPAYALFIGQSW